MIMSEPAFYKLLRENREIEDFTFGLGTPENPNGLEGAFMGVRAHSVSPKKSTQARDETRPDSENEQPMSIGRILFQRFGNPFKICATGFMR